LVEDVIDALRRLGPVAVSELTGRQETIEFRLPPELTEGRTQGRTAGRVTAKV
jgi:4-hydroxy-3-methylbut-2-enyl diphosphate reductase